MQYRHLQQQTHRGIYVTTCKIDFCYFVYEHQMYRSVPIRCLFLKSYTVLVHLHDITNFLNQKAFSSKHVIFLLQKIYMTSFLNFVTASLRTLFAWRGSILFCFVFYNWIDVGWRLECISTLEEWHLNSFFQTNVPLDIKNYIGRHNMVFK